MSSVETPGVFYLLFANLRQQTTANLGLFAPLRCWLNGLRLAASKLVCFRKMPRITSNTEAIFNQNRSDKLTDDRAGIVDLICQGWFQLLN